MMIAQVSDPVTHAGRQAGAILVVDDEPEVLDIVAEGLELTGYTVICAATAEDALLLAQTRADLLLVVSDVRLPGMSGLQLAERLTALGRGIRTILMSGYFSPQPVTLPLLHKPFTITDLEAAVASALSR